MAGLSGQPALTPHRPTVVADQATVEDGGAAGGSASPVLDVRSFPIAISSLLASPLGPRLRRLTVRVPDEGRAAQVRAAIAAASLPSLASEALVASPR